MANIYFELLHIAIGERKMLSRSLSDNDWQRMFIFCKRQALLGVCFSGVEKLYGLGESCPLDLWMKWYGYAVRIETLNQKLNMQCRELTAQIENDGFGCCVLKGQGNLLNYSENIRYRRNPGDIDLWVSSRFMRDAGTEAGMCSENSIKGMVVENDAKSVSCYGCRDVIRYVRNQYRQSAAGKRVKICYHHIEAPSVDGTHIEVHYRPAFMYSPLRNIRLQRWFAFNMDECVKNRTCMGFSVPTASVNVVYHMCHLFSHYFETGLGLRQLMDYYFVLMAWHNDCMDSNNTQFNELLAEGIGKNCMSKEEVMHTLKSFGVAKFAAAVMWVLHEVFAMSSRYYICEPNEKEGRRLLDEIMRGGNFGQYDMRCMALKNGGTIKHGIWKLKRIAGLVRGYPEHALCEPFFRVWHLGWRMIH